MCRRGIRRLPVVSKERVVGLVSLDDLIVQVGRELDSLGDTVHHQFREARRSAQRATRARAGDQTRDNRARR